MPSSHIGSASTSAVARVSPHTTSSIGLLSIQQHRTTFQPFPIADGLSLVKLHVDGVTEGRLELFRVRDSRFEGERVLERPADEALMIHEAGFLVACARGAVINESSEEAEALRSGPGVYI
jgi:hypothetical protein